MSNLEPSDQRAAVSTILSLEAAVEDDTASPNEVVSLEEPVAPSKFLCSSSPPGDHDVLLGRGGGTNNHCGNINFRELVNKHKIRYLACSKVEKPKVARELVQLWRKMDPPGRFLARDETNAKNNEHCAWFEVGDRRAREKASQCLRERTPEVLPYLKKLREEQDKVGHKEISRRKQNSDCETSETGNRSVPQQPSQSMLLTETSCPTYPHHFKRQQPHGITPVPHFGLDLQKSYCIAQGQSSTLFDLSSSQQNTQLQHPHTQLSPFVSSRQGHKSYNSPDSSTCLPSLALSIPYRQMCIPPGTNVVGRNSLARSQEIAGSCALDQRSTFENMIEPRPEPIKLTSNNLLSLPESEEVQRHFTSCPATPLCHQQFSQIPNTSPAAYQQQYPKYPQPASVTPSHSDFTPSFDNQEQSCFVRNQHLALQQAQIGVCAQQHRHLRQLQQQQQEQQSYQQLLVQQGEEQIKRLQEHLRHEQALLRLYQYQTSYSATPSVNNTTPITPTTSTFQLQTLPQHSPSNNQIQRFFTPAERSLLQNVNAVNNELPWQTHAKNASKEKLPASTLDQTITPSTAPLRMDGVDQNELASRNASSRIVEERDAMATLTTSLKTNEPPDQDNQQVDKPCGSAAPHNDDDFLKEKRHCGEQRNLSFPREAVKDTNSRTICDSDKIDELSIAKSNTADDDSKPMVRLELAGSKLAETGWISTPLKVPELSIVANKSADPKDVEVSFLSDLNDGLYRKQLLRFSNNTHVHGNSDFIGFDDGHDDSDEDSNLDDYTALETTEAYRTHKLQLLLQQQQIQLLGNNNHSSHLATSRRSGGDQRSAASSSDGFGLHRVHSVASAMSAKSTRTSSHLSFSGMSMFSNMMMTNGCEGYDTRSARGRSASENSSFSFMSDISDITQTIEMLTLEHEM